MIKIDMPMPDSCARCRFHETYNLKGYCRAAGGRLVRKWDNFTKPKWCPAEAADSVTDWEEVKDLEDGFYGVRDGKVYKLNLPIADPFKNATKVKLPAIRVAQNGDEATEDERTD